MEHSFYGNWFAGFLQKRSHGDTRTPLQENLHQSDDARLSSILDFPDEKGADCSLDFNEQI